MTATDYKSPERLSDFDLGWLVAIVDGEGSLILRLRPSKTRGHHIVDMSVQVTSTDEDIVQRLQQLCGGHIYGPRRKGSSKPCWNWRIHRRADVADLCAHLRPHLSQRRAARAAELIEAHERYASLRPRPG